MTKILKSIAVVFNATVLMIFGFFAFMIIDDGQAGSITLSENIELIDSKPPNIVHDDEQAMCMALNIYYESRSDNIAGQYAVADVVLNRVHDDRYPNSVCEVIKQGPVRESWKTKQDPDLPESERKYNPIRHLCQFSWYCDGKSDEPRDETGWAQAQYIAGAIMYSGKFRGITEGATHYHATYVRPSWAKTKKRTTRIEKHIFYRWEK